MCTNRKFNCKKRLENYPFNTATSIEFVSIKVDTVPKNEYTPIEYDGLPAIENPNFSDYLNERKKPDTKTINDLTDIIYDWGYNPKSSRPPIVLKGCYEPRNALLFLDEKDKVFAYIEICFHCGNIKLSSDKIQFGDLCLEKLERIKELFQKSGIKYGTIYTY